MRKRVIGVVAAVLLAAFGTLSLVAYVNGAEARALAGEETVEVLVVSEEVPASTRCSRARRRSFTTERVPAKVRAVNSVDNLEDLDGLVTAVDLVAGEQLVKHALRHPGSNSSSSSGIEVPDGPPGGDALARTAARGRGQRPTGATSSACSPRSSLEEGDADEPTNRGSYED